MEKAEFVTQMVPVEQLLKTFKNPRTIDARALEELKSQILKDPMFMLQRPILANRVNDRLVVYAGNQRLSACIALGLKEVPVRIEDNVQKELLDRRMLLDNVSRGEFIEEAIVKNFTGQIEMIQNAAMFKDMEFALNTKKPRQENKVIYTKIVFQFRDDLNLFYRLLDDLTVRYPDDSVGQRLQNWLDERIEEEQEEPEKV